MRVAVIGAGSWGTTVASQCSIKTPTILWARRAEIAKEITEDRTNRRYLSGFDLPRVESIDTAGSQCDQHVEVVEVLDQQGFGLPEEIDATDHRFSAGRTLDDSRREMGPHRRPGHETATELCEDEHRIGVFQTDPVLVLCKAQAEHAHLGQLSPQPAVEGTLLLELGQLFTGNATVAEIAQALLQGLLVLAQSKVHRSNSPVATRPTPVAAPSEDPECVLR